MKISQEDIDAVKAGLPGAEDAAIPASDREKMMEGGVPELGATLTPEQVRKPPLGAIPEHIWREQRIIDLAHAVARHEGRDFERTRVNPWIREMWVHAVWLEQDERQSK